MRLFVINYLKQHPILLRIFWKTAEIILAFLSKIAIIKPKNMLFASYGGRKFDDSPKAIYDEICKREEFKDWNLIWAFVEPDKFDIPRGKKIKIDTLAFFKALLTSHVWISNSGMSRGINIKNDKIIKVETWHGSVLKKGCGDENQGSLGGKKEFKGEFDNKTIRCAQSELDVDVLSWLMNATKESFIKAGFPRNDALVNATDEDTLIAKHKLGIPLNKKVILYAPTWRDYTIDNRNNVICAPPINLKKWKDKLGSKYILLFRAHYAVTAALNLKEDDFVKNVSDYPYINDLYLASDLLISDYSSAIIDYSVLEKPIYNFAYDLEEFSSKRGLYLDLYETMPCGVYLKEDELINAINNQNEVALKQSVHNFRKEHATFVKGYASKAVVDVILKKIL